MASVKVGERELEVAEATFGFVKRKWRPLRARLVAEAERLAATEGYTQEDEDRIGEIFTDAAMLFLPGCEREWVEDHLPVERAALSAFLRRLTDAAGITKPGEESPGEAPRP